MMKPYLALSAAVIAVVLPITALPAIEADKRFMDEERDTVRILAGATVVYLTVAYLTTKDASPWPPILASVGCGLMWYGTATGPEDTEGERLLKRVSTFIGAQCLNAALIWHAVEGEPPQEGEFSFRHVAGMVAVFWVLGSLQGGW